MGPAPLAEAAERLIADAADVGDVAPARHGGAGAVCRGRRPLYLTPDEERDEIERIYRGRGLSAELASQVAEQLSAVDPLELHAREELGIDLHQLARPMQAALVLSLGLGHLLGGAF